MDTDVRQARSAVELDEARRLFGDFLGWHRARTGGGSERLDAYFDEAAWQAELAGLPGDYAPLLLAWDGASAVGVAGLRDLGGGNCEMKRMYVADAARGLGVGRLLGAAVVRSARELGYDRLLLDTGPDQVEAIGLYRSLGFAETEAYHDVPPELRGWLLFFALDL